VAGTTVDFLAACGSVEAQAPRRKMHMSAITDRVKIEMLFMLIVPPLEQE